MADEAVAKGLVLVLRHGAVGELVLNRPERLNAISTAMAIELAERAEELAADATLRAVVVSSASERAFCVGADLRERSGMSHAELVAQRRHFRAGFAALRALPMPAIAAVGGFALGGGFEIALSCDLIVADEGAEFALPEVAVGLVPGAGGTQLLQRRVGQGPALDLVLSGRRLGVVEAAELGLLARRAPLGSAREVAIGLASSIAAYAPTALRAAKRAIRRGGSLPLDDALEAEHEAWMQAVSSGEWREGMAAFLEHRPARWAEAARWSAEDRQAEDGLTD